MKINQRLNPQQYMFLEDVQQFPYDISATLSDDINKSFDHITTEI